MVYGNIVFDCRGYGGFFVLVGEDVGHDFTFDEGVGFFVAALEGEAAFTEIVAEEVQNGFFAGHDADFAEGSDDFVAFMLNGKCFFHFSFIEQVQNFYVFFSHEIVGGADTAVAACCNAGKEHFVVSVVYNLIGMVGLDGFDGEAV